MDEHRKTRQELVLRVLGWGTVVYFLITGFALDQHALFELNPPPLAARLYEKKIAYADALEGKSRQLGKTDTVEAANLAMQAAQVRAEVDSAIREESDSRGRAIALIAGGVAFSTLYPLLIVVTYRRTDPDGTLAADDLVPLRAALLYGIVMSVVTAAAAIMTAYE
ncbi:hypothetical protein ABGB14_02490 [Nonomuraea sp. B10E15]|uniref:hypothetical protein n=1 Tax=Nonomuraea sp. B10E15 TaxID=3153560 RepID=UPI00325C3D81